LAETNTAKKRLEDLANKKHIAPTNSMLSDRMGFESSAAVSHLSNLFSDMFDRTFLNRRIEGQGGIVRVIDSDVGPSVADDEDLRKEVETSRQEASKRSERAQALLDNLPDFQWDSGIDFGGGPALPPADIPPPDAGGGKVPEPGEEPVFLPLRTRARAK
jgi:hypothetical protein